MWMLGVTGQLDQNVLWCSKWKMVVGIEIERDTHRVEICVVVAERGGYKEEPHRNPERRAAVQTLSIGSFDTSAVPLYISALRCCGRNFPA